MPRHPYVFAQFLHLLPRYEFQRIVNRYHGDYRTRSFPCWNQLVCITAVRFRV